MGTPFGLPLGLRLFISYRDLTLQTMAECG